MDKKQKPGKVFSCPECNRKLTERDLFCSKCGRKKDDFITDSDSSFIEIPNKYSKKAFAAVLDAWRLFCSIVFRVLLVCIVICVINISLKSPDRFSGCFLQTPHPGAKDKIPEGSDHVFMYVQHDQTTHSMLSVRWLCELSRNKPFLAPSVLFIKGILPVFLVLFMTKAASNKAKLNISLTSYFRLFQFCLLKFLLFSIAYIPVHLVLSAGISNDSVLIITGFCFVILNLYLLYLVYIRMILTECLILHKNLSLVQAIKASMRVTFPRKLTTTFFMLKAILFLKIVAFSSFFYDIFGFLDSFFTKFSSIQFMQGSTPDQIPPVMKFLIWFQKVGPSIPEFMQYVLGIIISAFCIAVIVIVYRDSGGFDPKKSIPGTSVGVRASQ